MDYTDVIIIKGPVETLSFFSERLAETFYTELNKNVFYRTKRGEPVYG